MSNTTVVDKDGLLQQAVSPDVETLSPTTPEVISRQATLNVGTIGHVAHGKSTLVRAISGVHPVRFADELKRNLTIKLGYANAKLFKCPKCPRPECFVSKGSATKHNEECPNKDCDGILELQRHVSFVDCPGHDILMATMLNGAAVMDAALLLVAGNESCPQPQTSEHLAAIEIMQLKHLIILQNKIDLVRRESAVQQHQQIREFVKGTCASDSPIIPISAQLGYNVDVLVEYMIKHIPIPDRDFSSTARMILIRSFDVNLPGCSVDKLRGGVAGGSLLQGILKLGDEVEIRPGVVVRNHETQKIVCTPIRSSIVSLLAEENNLKYAIPGGLIGVGTNVDPMLCRSDRLVGQVLGKPGNLPKVFIEIEVSFYLLRRLLGVKTNGGKASRVTKIANGEVLMLNIGSTATGGRVTAILGDHAKFSLTSLVCTQSGEKIAISRRVDKHWRLIGWGTIVRGVENEIMVV